jgi:succinate dehydrogenase / fumarate reductase cytochrome b subunit
MSAVASLGHRAAGVLLFLTIPYLLYLLQISLASESGFAMAKAEVQGPVAKLFWLIVIWSLAHHFLAGIRYFLLDFDIGVDRETAQKSAIFVMITGFIVAVICAFILF